MVLGILAHVRNRFVDIILTGPLALKLMNLHVSSPDYCPASIVNTYFLQSRIIQSSYRLAEYSVAEAGAVVEFIAPLLCSTDRVRRRPSPSRLASCDERAGSRLRRCSASFSSRTSHAHAPQSLHRRVFEKDVAVCQSHTKYGDQCYSKHDACQQYEPAPLVRLGWLTTTPRCHPSP